MLSWSNHLLNQTKTSLDEISTTFNSQFFDRLKFQIFEMYEFESQTFNLQIFEILPKCACSLYTIQFEFTNFKFNCKLKY